MTFGWYWLFACVLAAGCSGVPEATHTVEGTVTLDGAPLEGGSVLFVQIAPGESGQRYTARGAVGPGGRYELATFGEADGAVAGQYRVAVMSGYEPLGEAGDPPPPEKDVPPRYRNPDTSGLVFEVGPGDNVIDIPLVSEPAP